MTEYVENMSVDRLGRFFSPAKREVEYLRYPFTLSSQITGEQARIKNRDDLRRFLIAHKDAGATFDIAAILCWIDDQTTWSGVTPLSKNAEKLGRMDENWLFFT